MYGVSVLREIKMYRGVKEQLHELLVTALDQSLRVKFKRPLLYIREKRPLPFFLGNWVGPRADMDNMGHRNRPISDSTCSKSTSSSLCPLLYHNSTTLQLLPLLHYKLCPYSQLNQNCPLYSLNGWCYWSWLNDSVLLLFIYG